MITEYSSNKKINSKPFSSCI